LPLYYSFFKRFAGPDPAVFILFPHKQKNLGVLFDWKKQFMPEALSEWRSVEPWLKTASAALT
jgi:hypothetical protein